MFKILLRAIIAGEQQKAEIKVIGSDKIHYAVYPDGETGFIVYLLNTDYNISSKVNIVFGKCIAELDIGSCEIALAYIADDIILIPLDINVVIKEMIWEGNELIIEILGSGDHTLKAFSHRNLIFIGLNEKTVNFKKEIGFTNIDLSLDECSKLKLYF